jgi:hypothetical protein
MKSWTLRLGLVLTMLAMLLAVSVPTMADTTIVCLDDDGDGVVNDDPVDGWDDDGDGVDGEDDNWEGCDDLALLVPLDDAEDLCDDLDEGDDDDDDDDDNDDEEEECEELVGDLF